MKKWSVTPPSFALVYLKCRSLVYITWFIFDTDNCLSSLVICKSTSQFHKCQSVGVTEPQLDFFMASDIRKLLYSAIRCYHQIMENNKEPWQQPVMSALSFGPHVANDSIGCNPFPSMKVLMVAHDVQLGHCLPYQMLVPFRFLSYMHIFEQTLRIEEFHMFFLRSLVLEVPSYIPSFTLPSHPLPFNPYSDFPFISFQHYIPFSFHWKTPSGHCFVLVHFLLI